MTGEVTLSIIFKIHVEGRQKKTVLDCKKNFQNLICSSFLHQYSFGLVVSFPNFLTLPLFWMVGNYFWDVMLLRFVVITNISGQTWTIAILPCILVTRHWHVAIFSTSTSKLVSLVLDYPIIIIDHLVDFHNVEWILNNTRYVVSNGRMIYVPGGLQQSWGNFIYCPNICQVGLWKITETSKYVIYGCED